MAKATPKLQVKIEENAPERSAAVQGRQPLQSIRRGLDRFLEDFELDFWRSPRRSMFNERLRDRIRRAAPAVDIVESETGYEITADLPGFEKKNVEVKVVNGNLTIRGEKQDDKTEKKADYCLRERLFGSFERSFRIPEGVDTGKIEASFQKGVLTVTLSKKPKAQRAERKSTPKTTEARARTR